MRTYYIYILTNATHTTLYVGVTNNLERRVDEHQSDVVKGFSNKYKTHKLVYYEETTDIMEALNREKTLKKWSREKKNNLINLHNPEWKDLSKLF